MGRALAFLLVFLLGALFGASYVAAVVPEVDLGTALGSWIDPLDLSEYLGPLVSAVRGIAIALIWMSFGLVVALLFSAVSRLFGGAFR
ncbi:MAG: hypothetical protein AAGC56_06810 [Pseudomonadota bacterium]